MKHQTKENDKNSTQELNFGIRSKLLFFPNVMFDKKWRQ
jgi:hypothetical protein